MKKTIMFLSITMLLLAGIFFMYGTVKYSEAQEEQTKTIDIGDKIKMVRENQAQNFSSKALNIATFLSIGGIALFIISRGMKK